MPGYWFPLDRGGEIGSTIGDGHIGELWGSNSVLFLDVGIGTWD